MVNIRKFIDKVSSVENRHGKDLTMPISDARMLKDEIAHLMAKLVAAEKPQLPEAPTEIQLKSRRW